MSLYSSHPVLAEVQQERARQDALWGEQNHDAARWMLVLGEEFGEACKDAVELTWHPTPVARDNLRAELVQVAAVAVAFIESIDRAAERRCDAPSCPHCEAERNAKGEGNG